MIPDSVLRRFWHPVGWSTEFGTQPSGTLLLGERVVLWRDATGTLVAAADRCPHRGTALSLGETDADGAIVCPYHGWAFSPEGACTAMPQLSPDAPRPGKVRLPMYQATERYGLAWVCLDEPIALVPDFPEWRDPRYRHVPCASYTWRTGPARMVENFTDFGHLGYLHDGLLGSRDDLVVPAHRVSSDALQLRYELTMTVPDPKNDFAVADLADERGTQHNRYVLTLPFTIHLACTYVEQGTHRTLFFAVQPRGDGSCTGYCYQSRDFDLDGDDAPYAEFQAVLAEQDRRIVESQLPEEVPLELGAEVQMPFDRVATAYRRALSALVASVEQPEPSEQEVRNGQHAGGASLTGARRS